MSHLVGRRKPRLRLKKLLQILLQPHPPHRESKMLQDLSQEQVESALRFLSSPLVEPPPQGLEHLNSVEWLVLGKLLEQLQWERANNLLQ
jgi:hypothetical protein